MTNTLVKEYEYISRCDPAIDDSVPDFEQAWKAYLDGMGPAPLKPDAKPIRITLRHLNQIEMSYIRETFVGGERQDARGATMAAAMIALANVSGLDGEDGKPFKIRHESTPWGLARIRHATGESYSFLLTALGGGDAPMFDIGNLAWSRSTLRPS